MRWRRLRLKARHRILNKGVGEDMSLSVVVMGASGRMGTTIANLAKEQGMHWLIGDVSPERIPKSCTRRFPGLS